MSDFDKTPDWYETDTVIDSGIPEDQYGNEWYSVKFHGNAESALWLAKDKPKDSTKYYGHFETTSGGKLRFKRDKEPEEEQRPPGAHTSPQSGRGSSKDITLGMVWKTLIGIVGVPENDDDFAKLFEIIDAHVTELVLMSEKLNQ